MSKLSKTAIHRGVKNSDAVDAKFHRFNPHTEVMNFNGKQFPLTDKIEGETSRFNRRYWTNKRKARYLKKKNLS